ncbi:hypothetical protein Ssi03_56950 [Sphaerisporangium siamense]|uniref:Uncharacterized protein n=1 Tax=Sphaerisporangium siamense TaxID=795645 RepID=A0A7W7D4R2_9ACTN|nr:hemopexin repeat-containing protein [Sphaerisporangium siamense]MBB4700290.1 hypothetical protein [Sphaerisporangium siamense]GII87705.1 hypothetical protein Ssi03_56950 [Sphaerisporangium siamense]
MPLLEPMTTLDLTKQEGYEQDYLQFIRALRRGLTRNGSLQFGTYTRDGETRVVYRVDDAADPTTRDGYFSVRLTAGDGGAVDLYIRRDNLYSIGFAQVDARGNARRFYYLGGEDDRRRVGALDLVPDRDLVGLGIGENYQDLERAAGTGRTSITMSRSGLDQRVRDLLLDSPSTAQAAQGILLLTEMICEATRFYYISRAVHAAWSQYTSVDADTRRQMSDLERNWQVISLDIQRRGENPLPADDARTYPPLTVGTLTFTTVFEVAAALAVMYLKTGSAGRSGYADATVLAAADDGDIRYPVIDAAVNLRDSDNAVVFFQANEIMLYDVSKDTILVGPLPISYSWPALAGTDFADGVSAATAIPGATATLWLFRGSKYVRYSATDQSILVGPKEIYDGWPGLRGTAFVDYIDAAVKDPSGANAVYLFRGPEVVRYNLDNDTITGPSLITNALPGLEQTDFVHGVSAALACPGFQNQVWLFRDDEYLRYNTYDCQIRIEPKPIAAGWSGLQNKLFVDRIDAALPHPTANDEIWFFRDGYYLRFNATNNVISHVVTPIAEGWQGLKAHGEFTRRIDAALENPQNRTQAWFFHGHSYLTYDVEADSVVRGPLLIEDGWAGLGSAGFDHIDAAVPVPGSPDDAWLFKDDQYLRYSLTSSHVLIGPKPIEAGWAGLRGTGFAERIDAAVRYTGPESQLWLFSGNAYVRYDLGSDSIVIGPKAIINGWNLNLPVAPFPKPTTAD